MENKRRTNFFAKGICGAEIILFVSLFINKTLKITFCLTTKNSVVLLREGFTVCGKTSSWHLFSLHSNALKPQATAAFLQCSFFLPLANFFLLEFFFKKWKWHVGKGQNKCKLCFEEGKDDDSINARCASLLLLFLSYTTFT